MAGEVIGDYVSLQRGTTYQGTLVGKPGPALLGLGSIVPGGGFRHADFTTYGGECPANLMLYPSDLYVSLKGATKDGQMIGSVARVPASLPSGRLTQDTVKLIFADAAQEFKDYLYWLLRTPQYRTYCAARAMGSAVVALSRADFLSYPVPPLISFREHLVRMFEATDSKIELNRKMNETLEAMARALFKSWFVDFDPVRAKSEGRNLVLPAPIAALFPDSFEDSELGAIPTGWTIGSLADIALLNPESWAKNTKPDMIRYVDLANTKWGKIEAIAPYSKTEAPSRAQRILRRGDTIIGTVRPGNGSYALIAEEGLTGSTGFAVLRPRKSEYREVIYLTATAPENIGLLAHVADGGAYPAVRPEVVIAKKVVMPPETVIAHFSKLAEPLISRLDQSNRESRALAAMRDTLLPKLISGEIRVGEQPQHLPAEVQHG